MNDRARERRVVEPGVCGGAVTPSDAVQHAGHACP